MKGLITLLLLFSNISVATETVKIAIIDTGLDIKDQRFQEHICKKGHKDFTKTSLDDFHGHGTFIAGLLQKNIGSGNYCFLIYKFYSDQQIGSQNMSCEVASIKEAIANGAQIVNLSGGGPERSEDEYLAIKSNPNVKFVVAAGNENQDISAYDQWYFPASYDLPNIMVVGSLDKDGTKSKTSNYGKLVKFWELGEKVTSTLPGGLDGEMSGTSMSTPVQTSKLVRSMLKHRDSTNQ